jgi:translocation and assembly module TamA
LLFRSIARIAVQIAAALATTVTLTLAIPGSARAAGLNYDVAVEAPAPLKALLEANLDLLRWRGNARIDAEQLQRLYRAAPEQIRTLAATEGFYTPTITTHLQRPDNEQADSVWHVQLTVAPGNPARVARLTLELRGFGDAGLGARQDTQPFDSARLRAAWPLQTGQIFRQADWEEAKRALLRQAMLQRYPRASLVESLATVDADSGQASLRLVLDSGPAVHFGALRIEGPRHFPAALIANLNPIRPGDVYDETKLLTLQTRLQETGYYSAIEITTDVDGALGSPNGLTPEQIQAATGSLVTAPLIVKVSENRRKKAGVGLGYSTNTGQRAQVTYDDLDVMGLRLGSGVTLETKKQTAHADLYFPATDDGYNDSIGTRAEHSTVSGEITGLVSVAAKRSWGSPTLERNLTLESVSERQTITGYDTTHAKALPLTYGITLRRVDNLIFPTKGYALSAQLGAAPVRLLTDQTFVRGTAKLIGYLPLGSKSTVVLRAELGALESRNKDGVPATYLFRAGGDQSVRGYAYQGLGIKVGDAVVGGRYLATGSAEYQYWFEPSWGAAVFYDAGNAADSIKDLKPKSGYGLGARWKSPVGPINADIAYGHAVRQYRLHFSLGFTF